MGIQGLFTFCTKDNASSLLSEHKLSNCPLVVDGPNLEKFIMRSYTDEHRNDLPFGVDYTHFAEYVRTFFTALIDCDVKPIVLMAGSFDTGKLETKVERFNSRLETAIKVANCQPIGEDNSINGLLSPLVFVQVVRQLAIPIYQSIYEADDMVTKTNIARDLRCPILSKDGDNFVEDVDEGVILLDDLVKKVFSLKEENVDHIPCKIYKIANLCRLFPGLTPSLAKLAGALLNTEKAYSVEFGQMVKIVKTLIGQLPSRSVPSHVKGRKFQIYALFKWLSAQSTAASALTNLKRLLPNHQGMLNAIHRELFLEKPAPPKPVPSSIAEYFEFHLEELLPPNPDIPESFYKRYINLGIQKRFISIYLERQEFLRPLVEDMELSDSTYECTFELLDDIYGLLRSDPPKPIKRYFRQGKKYPTLVHSNVNPKSQTKDGVELPLLSEIGSLSEKERLKLFWDILGLPSTLFEEIKEFVKKDKSLILEGTESSLNQFATLLLSLVYFARHFSTPIWIEAFYSLYANIFLTGHCSGDACPNVPTLFQVSKSLSQNISKYDQLPKISKQTYRPRIAHYYNAFQNCVLSIGFLAEILDLNEHFDMGDLICGLQGSFIYNLANDLIGKHEPLEYLSEKLWGLEKTFCDLFNLVKINCNREMLEKNETSLTEKEMKEKGHSYFIRAD